MRLKEILVRVPKETGVREKLYLSGNHSALGRWQLPGIPLERIGEGLYLARVAVPDGQTIECKVHRGNWKKVEKDAAGGDILNHRLIMKPGRRQEIRVARWKPRDKPANSTALESVRYHRRFVSKHLGNSRSLAVYLPPQYESEPQRRFPVLYMHDGQNLFDVATAFAGVEWGADKTAQRLIEAGRLEPLIIVGIYNNEDRLNEYAPISELSRQAGGRGADYARFVVEEVKPFIDHTYRTLPQPEHTGVAGSSLGGLISLYLGLEYPHVFSRLGVISPALWWGRQWILSQARRKGR
ncbi:MAG TPA: alpha/beta hydrolase-fold protein, partial [Candidatus Ozemobacteraceae bacterium]|nr:alpha/beta hydrolase-fold protein [Candidatus Ozemobacteraceae bacterium]